MSAHTPTPWMSKELFNRPGFFVVMQQTGHGLSRVDSNGTLTEANAAFIVRACNAHEQLVAALGHILSMAEDARTDTDIQRALKMNGIETLARAVLAAAKGQP